MDELNKKENNLEQNNMVGLQDESAPNSQDYDNENKNKTYLLIGISLIIVLCVGVFAYFYNKGKIVDDSLNRSTVIENEKDVSGDFENNTNIVKGNDIEYILKYDEIYQINNQTGEQKKILDVETANKNLSTETQEYSKLSLVFDWVSKTPKDGLIFIGMCKDCSRVGYSQIFTTIEYNISTGDIRELSFDKLIDFSEDGTSYLTHSFIDFKGENLYKIFDFNNHQIIATITDFEVSDDTEKINIAKIIEEIYESDNKDFIFQGYNISDYYSGIRINFWGTNKDGEEIGTEDNPVTLITTLGYLNYIGNEEDDYLKKITKEDIVGSWIGCFPQPGQGCPEYNFYDNTFSFEVNIDYDEEIGLIYYLGDYYLENNVLILVINEEFFRIDNEIILKKLDNPKTEIYDLSQKEYVTINLEKTLHTFESFHGFKWIRDSSSEESVRKNSEDRLNWLKENIKEEN